MRPMFTSSLLVLGLMLASGCANRAEPVAAASDRPPVAAPVSLAGEPAPLPALVSEVQLPYEKFTLDNGLTVLVNEDPKTPVVAVGVWYNVGSKDEPKGKTGFAHLFEHLMFYGSDNLREGIMGWLEKVGATDWNGSTWYDRTNYYQTVPKSALEKALFMESDRMGYLLPAIDQKRLDLQRGVVQNEKRQRDNAPGGLVGYTVSETLLPEGHPYRHSTIGSMADLDAASLADTKQWFIDKYGPNNAVLALSGDITVAEARTLVEKYFGAIPRGAVNVPGRRRRAELAGAQAAGAQGPRRRDLGPALLDRPRPAVRRARRARRRRVDPRRARQQPARQGAGARREDRGRASRAGYQPFQRLGNFTVTATVKPGVDPALVERRLDELLADYIANGPSADEIQRAATMEVAQRIRSLEKTGDDGKIEKLAEGYLYNNDPLFFRSVLASYAALTPDKVRSSLQRWISRPALTIVLEPGERPPYEEAKGAPRNAPKADLKVASIKRDDAALGPGPGARLPRAQPGDFVERDHCRLRPAHRLAGDPAGARFRRRFRRRPGRPARIAEHDARAAQRRRRGQKRAADRRGKRKAGRDDHRGRRSPTEASSSCRRCSANLAPSLGLMRDVVVNPDFSPAEVGRVRDQLLTAVAQAQEEPRRDRAARASAARVRRQPSLWRHRARRRSRDQRDRPRRSDRVQGPLAARRQGQVVRRLRPPAGARSCR